ncbi:hypothetical protein [Burkholderia gladioli]|uniref:hypothetical protein n=1 Tax=Burkholderia gladioli TaxID=28095 RepID=UPI00163E4D11|nr:hypothetical protein [Burkholderia gladioli]
MSIRDRIVQRALSLAARKISPDTIPTGGPRVRERDYFLTRLAFDDGSRQFFVDGIQAAGLKVLGLDNATDRFSVSGVLPWNEATKAHITICTYYRQYAHETSSPGLFVLAQLFRWPKISVEFDDLAQSLFNWTRLKRHSRISILRKLVAFTLSNEQEYISAISLTGKRKRAIHHPGWKEALSRNTNLLDGLVDEGLAVKKDFHRYRSTGHAQAKLDEHRRAVVLTWLRGGGLLVGAMWAIFTFAVPNWASVKGWLKPVTDTASDHTGKHSVPDTKR